MAQVKSGPRWFFEKGQLRVGWNAGRIAVTTSIALPLEARTVVGVEILDSEEARALANAILDQLFNRAAHEDTPPT